MGLLLAPILIIIGMVMGALFFWTGWNYVLCDIWPELFKIEFWQASGLSIIASYFRIPDRKDQADEDNTKDIFYVWFMWASMYGMLWLAIWWM